MKFAQCAPEIIEQAAERRGERLLAGDQHIIEAGTPGIAHHLTDDSTQASADAIAHHRIAGLLGDRETDANVSSVTAIPPLQEKGGYACAFRLCRSQEITALAELIHDRHGSAQPAVRRTDACDRERGGQR